MLKLVPLKGPRGTNLDGYFVDANSPTGRVLRRTTSTMAFDESPDMKPTTGKDNEDNEMVAAALQNMSPEQIADLIKKCKPADIQKIWNLLPKDESNEDDDDDDVAQDDEEETGANPKASARQRNDLGIDKARRAFDSKDAASGKKAADFHSRWGDRIKVLG